VATRDEQDVPASVWVQRHERDVSPTRLDDLGMSLATDDLAEDAVGHRMSSSVSSVDSVCKESVHHCVIVAVLTLHFASLY
jgi:hypothetical protein